MAVPTNANVVHLTHLETCEVVDLRTDQVACTHQSPLPGMRPMTCSSVHVSSAIVIASAAVMPSLTSPGARSLTGAQGMRAGSSEAVPRSLRPIAAHTSPHL